MLKDNRYTNIEVRVYLSFSIILHKFSLCADMYTGSITHKLGSGESTVIRIERPELLCTDNIAV